MDNDVLSQCHARGCEAHADCIRVSMVRELVRVREREKVRVQRKAATFGQGRPHTHKIQTSRNLGAC